jgi:hypothetical protein
LDDPGSNRNGHRSAHRGLACTHRTHEQHAVTPLQTPCHRTNVG